MSLEMRWVGEAEYDRLAAVRVQCYAPSMSHVDRFVEVLKLDERARPGDYLIAERDGIDVGTATSLSLRMWIRGACLPCQGVAYVGTVKTHRRGGSKGERGIATQVMQETIRQARQRGDVVSALMPFRASFYEHFGYGLAEKRTEWTLPLGVLPTGDFDGFRFAQPRDQDAIAALRQREVQRGQCNIERSPQGWQNIRKVFMPRNEGMEVVDRPEPDGPVLGWIYFVEARENGRTMLRAIEMSYDSTDALRRQLHFLASLKDQYSAAMISLPGDLELNRLLKEDQIPHRPVEHAAASAKPYTRMQIRVLDHQRLLSAMHLPPEPRGKLTVAVKESEGSISRFQLDIADGRIEFSAAMAGADLECSDVMWSSLISGDISAARAAGIGLINVQSQSALRLLDVFSMGPVPFSTEYF
jgi:predicted acetyltransferase